MSAKLIINGRLLTGVIVAALVTAPAHAEVQRIGFPQGTFTLAAKAATTLTGYCLDRQLDAPAQGARLSHVANPASLKLLIGGVQVDPVAAIADGRLRIEPSEVLVRDVLEASEMTAGEAGLTKGMEDQPVSVAINRLKTRGPAKPNAQFLAMLEAAKGQGDGQHFRLVNGTAKPMQVTFESPVVLHDKPVTAGKLPLDLVRAAPSVADEKLIQQDIWLAGAALEAAETENSLRYFVDRVATRTSLIQALLGLTEEPVVAMQKGGDQTAVLVRLATGFRLFRVGAGLIRSAADFPDFESASAAMFAATHELILIAERSTNARFVHVGMANAEGKHQVLVSTSRLELTAAEVAELGNGLPVPKFDALLGALPAASPVVLVRGPWEQGQPLPTEAAERLRQQPESVRLYAGIRSRFLSRRFLFDDPDPSTINRISNLPTVKNQNDVALVSERKSFKVRDYGIVANIEEEFANAKVEVVNDVLSSGGKVPTASNVLLLVGNKDAAYLRFLEELGRLGIFKDKLVVSFSCYQETDPRFASYMLSKWGARGVIYFNEKIYPPAIEAVLVEAAKALSAHGLVEGLDAEGLMRMAIENALKRARSPLVRAALETLRFQIVYQVGSMQTGSERQRHG